MIAVNDAKGNIKFNQLINTTATGAVTGAFWGTLIGLISNRLSWGCGAHALFRRFRWRADSKLLYERFPTLRLPTYLKSVEITTMSSRTVWVWVAVRTAAAAAWDGGPGLLEPARSGGAA